MKIRCESAMESWRVKTLLTKEPGTIAWLEGLQPGDVFYDIGANIGLYSILAAKRGAQVYAFEPHVANARALIRNACDNGLGGIRLLSCALGAQSGFVPFFYASQEPGSSGSQIIEPVGETGLFPAVATELKYCATLWDLVVDGVIPLPAMMKIDVDGRELDILRGAHGLLESANGPRSIQVEVHPESAAEIRDFLTARDYVFHHRHDTARGKQLLEQKLLDQDAGDVAHNAVWERAA